MSLKLIPANDRRGNGPWSPDDFDVIRIEDGALVGRIFRDTVSSLNETPWWWGLAFPFTLNAQQPFYGRAASKDAAKQTFGKTWRAREPNVAVSV